MKSLNNVKFLKSTVSYNDMGESKKEVAFIGRSNVGKSSVINAVCNHKRLAFTSQKPGKTRVINVYDAGDYKWLIDLPGYGFATGSIEERAKWEGMIEGYLKSRANLKMIYLIVDAEIGPTKTDIQTADWLTLENMPFSIIANKSDKVRVSMQNERRLELSGKLGFRSEDIFWVSAEKKTGILELEADILLMLE
jgi:GTP-binding protein